MIVGPKVIEVFLSVSGDRDSPAKPAQRAGLVVLTVVALSVPMIPARAVVGPRTYATQAQCESDRALPPGLCRTAFANALAEFAAKAPTFRSRRACFQRFGPCMPWPIGAHTFDEFRPQWLGVTITTSAPDGIATPAVAPGKVRLDFAPQSLSSLSPGAATAHDAEPKSTSHAEPVAKFMQPDDDGEMGPASPPPPPGSGFKMIDGVLTYPAPARFQPKALRRQ